MTVILLCYVSPSSFVEPFKMDIHMSPNMYLLINFVDYYKSMCVVVSFVNFVQTFVFDIQIMNYVLAAREIILSSMFR